MDRQRYSLELNRELFLQALGYRIVSIAYDDVAARPDLCIMLLRTLFGAYRPGRGGQAHSQSFTRDLLRYAFTLARPLRPKDVADHFGINHRTAIKHLKFLCEKGWVVPVSRSDSQLRVTHYALAPDAWHFLN